MKTSTPTEEREARHYIKSRMHAGFTMSEKVDGSPVEMLFGTWIANLGSTYRLVDRFKNRHAVFWRNASFEPLDFSNRDEALVFALMHKEDPCTQK